MRRSKEDAEQTRCAILDAAEQMFCEQGVSNSALEKISRKAGVTRGALYWHFKDKIDLLRALHSRCEPPQKLLIRKVAEEGHDDPLGFLQQTAAEVLIGFEQDERQQRIFIIMNSYSCDPESIAWMNETNAEMFMTIAALTNQAQAQGSLSPDFSPEETAGILMATMNGLLSEWLRSGKCFSVSDLGTRFLNKQMAIFRRPATCTQAT
ncbi:TetR family transcriptional regulator [Cypionkella aquatica]|uniref:TetR family transcriptional regulator n=1 Tax=Cypionkella aquatica TaxID=1756042 RepID=A0AA37X5N0_9RHOB|nr:TetR family transcriptional regulator [Cypionkella aquatica]